MDEIDEMERDQKNYRRNLAAQPSWWERHARRGVLTGLALIAVFLVGLGSGFMVWGRDEANAAWAKSEMDRLGKQVAPAGGYQLPIAYGDLGPKMVAGGVIESDAFLQALAEDGIGIEKEAQTVLSSDQDAPIVMNTENAHFLLNFFWAVGLSNRNAVLEGGPITTVDQGNYEEFASTGGWDLGAKPLNEIYSSLPLVALTDVQQARLEQVARNVFRPCCNNAVIFPDCNHGMAMLGMLELMAAQGRSEAEMYRAAKAINAYWFPQEYRELALYFQMTRGLEFRDVDAQYLLGSEYSSGTGSAAIHQYLIDRGVIKPDASSGVSCGS